MLKLPDLFFFLRKNMRKYSTGHAILQIQRAKSLILSSQFFKNQRPRKTGANKLNCNNLLLINLNTENVIEKDNHIIHVVPAAEWLIGNYQQQIQMQGKTGTLLVK